MRQEIVHTDIEDIIIPIPESYKDCITLIRSDYFRVYNDKNANIFKMWLKLPFNFQLRMAAYRGPLQLPFRIIHRLSSRRRGLQISPKTKIGYGLYIGHHFGTIVNANAIIGNNVNLSQFTTIGGVADKAAIIGNNVYIGPTVCVVGDVIIHSHSTIGAGAVVTRNVPSNTTVGGVPARIIENKSHEDYVNRRWKF